MKKATLAVAISSALISSAAFAQTSDKYNLQQNLKFSQHNAQISAAEAQKEAVTWLVKSNTPSLAQRAGKQNRLSQDQISTATSQIGDSLNSLEQKIMNMDLDVKVINRTTKLTSALVIEGHKDSIKHIEALDEVAQVFPVYDYRLYVAESADYIKATKVISEQKGSGKGIKVAILDTGVDYTHAALGGSGKIEDYEAAAADPADTPAWPQGKVAGGYDFVNNDPDPLDITENHGTHVSHSVTGIAPDVELYVYSVCEEFCSGAAQLAALEAAMDPNGDGDISDRVDVINMSLGADFGSSRGGAVQELLDQAANLGVVSALSAGNDGPTPYIVGGPSTTKNVISVGAMTHPVTKLPVLTSTVAGESITTVGAGFNPTSVFSFTSADTPLVYPDANQEACEAFADDIDFTGQAVVVDRGSCSFVDKVKFAQDKGAVFVIVANNREGAAFAMGGTSSELTIPSVMVDQPDGDKIKAAITAGNAEYSIGAVEFSQEGAIATFTSRGPSIEGFLKPEITAPGTSIMTAHPGLGDGLSPISGTSFSSPITAGALGILSEAFPDRSALELKATLMNTANMNVTMEPRDINPDTALAPISYIGAGLVDLDRAVNSSVIAWSTDTQQAALAFGYVEANAATEMTKTVMLKNFSSEAKTYKLSIDERYADDTASGAISFEHPAEVVVPAGQSITFDVKLSLDPSKLPEWKLTGDLMGEDIPGATNELTVSEYDGALIFSEDGENEDLHLVYHILPKATSEIGVHAELTNDGAVKMVTNNGVNAISPYFVPVTVSNTPDPSAPVDMVTGSIETIASSSCDNGYLIATSFVANDFISTPNIAGFYLDLDTDNDGTFDHTIQTISHKAFNRDNPPGRVLTFSHATGETSGTLRGTSHTSGNNHLTMFTCAEDVEMTAENVEQDTITASFRIEFDDRAFAPTAAPIRVVSTELVLGDTVALPSLVDAEGNAVSSIAAGQSAMLKTSGNDFVMLANDGANPVFGEPSKETGQAPTVAAQAFAVDENTENDTVIGKIVATDVDMLTSPVSEIHVQSSNSNAVKVSRDGTIMVADASVLDFDAGLEQIDLTVVAIDTQGNISAPAAVTITVNNLVDTPAEQPPAPAPTPAPSSSSSGGSTGLLALLMLPLAIIRRRMSK